MFLKLTYIAGD